MVDGEVDWGRALRDTAHAFRRAALAHPNVVPSLVTRSLSGPLALRPPGMLRPLEELLELFSRAGFDEHGALHAARLFTGFLYQHLLHELQERVDNPDETDDVLRLGLHRLPITEFPRLRSLAGILATYDGAAELDEGLDIRHRRAPQPTPDPGPADPQSRRARIPRPPAEQTRDVM